MVDNLAPILVSLVAMISVGITFAIARRIFTGQLTPLDIKGLIERQDEQIAELKRQNEMLKNERENDRVQLRETLNEATKAIYGVTSWLTRYEDRGGFASPGPKAPPRKEPVSE